MTDLVPRAAPIPGGGACDICGRRSFRRIFAGWRHVGCEPDDRHLRGVEASARVHARLLAGLPERPIEDAEVRLADVVELPISNGNGTDP